MRAHFLAFIDPAFIDLAGFTGPLPDRSMFSKPFREMAWLPELVERATAEMVGQIRNVIPDLGREIAVDSTPVKSRSTPNFELPSDPEAMWIRHDRAGAKGDKEWEWGHRLQIAVDVNCDIPLWINLSRENNDSP